MPNLQMTRQNKLEAVKQYFLKTYVEDPIDGTPFDTDVLNALDALQAKYQEKLFWCKSCWGEQFIAAGDEIPCCRHCGKNMEIKNPECYQDS